MKDMHVIGSDDMKRSYQPPGVLDSRNIVQVPTTAPRATAHGPRPRGRADERYEALLSSSKFRSLARLPPAAPSIKQRGRERHRESGGRHTGAVRGLHQKLFAATLMNAPMNLGWPTRRTLSKATL